MAKRTVLTKRIRFEVFKRDKFTCQYCGAKSPEVILNVDHIDPVANGGGNEIINLITSCFDCNSGKSDKLLQDRSVVEKQRKQLELLQERREQIELMLEWKKSLSDFDNDVNVMIAEYVDSKMQPWTLSESGKSSIKDWLKKFEVQNVLNAIDIAATNYLKYDDDGATNESSDLFISKIGGVLHVQSLPPIQQKLAYIKGIARNRFSYWDDRKGAIVLSDYIKALEAHYDEAQIINDLEKDVERITKSSKNWSEWKNTLEDWIEEIDKWEKKETEDHFTTEYLKKDYTEDQLNEFIEASNGVIDDHLLVAEYLACIIPDFDKSVFRQLMLREMLNFLTAQKEGTVREIKEYDDVRPYIENYIHNTELDSIFSKYQDRHQIRGYYIVETKFYEEITEVLFMLYYPPMPIKQHYKDRMIDIHANALIDIYDSVF